MKDSYFKTPRTMSECTFQDWGQTVFIERTPKPFKALMVASVIILFASVGVMLWK